MGFYLTIVSVCGFSWILHKMKKLRKFNWKLRLMQRSSCTHNMRVCAVLCWVCMVATVYRLLKRIALREWRVSSYMHGISVSVFRKNITEDQCCWKGMRASAKPEPLYCYKRHRIKATNKVFWRIKSKCERSEKKRKKTKTSTRTTSYHYKWQCSKTWESACCRWNLTSFKTKRWWKLQSCKIKILHIMSHICHWVGALVALVVFIHDCFHVCCACAR